jgi:ATP-dependent helicase/nuclease subunit A
MNTVPHEAILASAGSGKTFQLAHRYIRLLALGVAPDRIIAITFSRKAASEIFTAIVMRLCEAATDAKTAADAALHIQHPGFTCVDFLRLLRNFLTDLQRLHISTIDSFTIGILRAFPMELGIPPSFDVMDNAGPTAEKARADTMDRLFRAEDMRIEDEDDLYEAFKQATFGREEKNVAAKFAQFIEEYHLHYKLLPDQDAWGNPARIWGDGFPWAQGIADPDRFKTELESALSSVTWDTFGLNFCPPFLRTSRANRGRISSTWPNACSHCSTACRN